MRDEARTARSRRLAEIAAGIHYAVRTGDDGEPETYDPDPAPDVLLDAALPPASPPAPVPESEPDAPPTLVFDGTPVVTVPADTTVAGFTYTPNHEWEVSPEVAQQLADAGGTVISGLAVEKPTEEPAPVADEPPAPAPDLAPADAPVPDAAPADAQPAPDAPAPDAPPDAAPV